MTYDPAISANANLSANGLQSCKRETHSQVRDIIDESDAVVYVAGPADDLCAWMAEKAEAGK